VVVHRHQHEFGRRHFHPFALAATQHLGLDGENDLGSSRTAHSSHRRTGWCRPVRHSFGSWAVARIGTGARRAAERGRVRLDCELSFRAFDPVAIAAGAWSKKLACKVGDRGSLGTERGYHLDIGSGEAGESYCPVAISERGFPLAPCWTAFA
jgi:hypothetical protein